MKNLWLVVAALTLFMAWMMAFAASGQLFGIRGKIVNPQFILGPSWGWVAFDVLAFVFDACVFAGCVYMWAKPTRL